MNRDDILEIAALCRQSLERFNQWLVENKSTVRYDSNLGGLCAMASEFLFDKLKQLGYNNATFICATPPSGYGCHCWVKVDDLNVDITATQFRPCAKVYTYTGDVEDHPIFNDWKANNIWPHEQDGYEYLKASTFEEISEILSEWNRHSRMEAAYELLNKYFGGNDV